MADPGFKRGGGGLGTLTTKVTAEPRLRFLQRLQQKPRKTWRFIANVTFSYAQIPNSSSDDKGGVRYRGIARNF